LVRSSLLYIPKELNNNDPVLLINDATSIDNKFYELVNRDFKISKHKNLIKYIKLNDREIFLKTYESTFSESFNEVNNILVIFEKENIKVDDFVKILKTQSIKEIYNFIFKP